MSIVIKNQLDPVFEILNLLYLTHTPRWKEDLLEEMTAYGLDGEQFYQKHYKIVEKYLKTFQKYRTPLPQEDFFFQQSSEDFFFLLLTFGAEHTRIASRRCLISDGSADPIALRSYLAYYLTDTSEKALMPPVSQMPQLPDDKAILDFLENLEGKSHEKWQLLELLRKPEEKLEKLVQLISANYPAYEKALEAVTKPLEKLLTQHQSFEDPLFMKITETFSQERNMTVFVSLIQPLLQFVMYTKGYTGLFNQHLSVGASRADSSKELLLRQLKALSDKSKLDILCTLNRSSMYNLELSEALHLSPSTMSHHMGALLSCGFVTVEKQNGKVYYQLEKEQLRLFLQQLQQLFL